jgi:hypothetical protein
MKEAKRLAVHGESPTLAGAALGRRIVAVPAVRIVHVGSGGKDSLGSAQQHHGQVVVFGHAIQAAADGLAHAGVVGVALPGIVQRNRRDSPVGIDLEEHAIVRSAGGSHVAGSFRRLPNLNPVSFSGGDAKVWTSPVQSTSSPRSSRAVDVIPRSTCDRRMSKRSSVSTGVGRRKVTASDRVLPERPVVQL